MFRCIVPVLFLAMTVGAAGEAYAQSFPARPIRLIVGDAPGGSSDIVGRVMATNMAPILGKPVVVENKPGAGYAIAFEHVAKQAPADGHTIAFVFVQSLATLPLAVKDMRFDALKDLPPFIGLAQVRYVLGSSPKRPWTNVAEMIAYAKANPGKLTYGSNGPIAQIVTEAILKELGVKALMVPFSSGSVMVQALVQEQIDLGIPALPISLSMGNNFRIMALTGDKRIASRPEIPTFAEVGLGRLRSFSYSLNAPAGTPREALGALYAAASGAMKQPEVQAIFAKLHLEQVEQSPESAVRELQEQANFYAQIAAEIGLQPK